MSEPHSRTELESARFIAQQRQKQCATEALSTMQLPRKAVKAGTIFGNALNAVQKSPAKSSVAC